MSNVKIRPVEVFPVVFQDTPCLVLRDPTRLSESTVVVPQEMLFVVQRLDGKNSLLDIQAGYMRATGNFLYTEKLEELVRGLDEAFLLDNERFAQHREDLVGAFREAPVRRPSHAGGSYPAERAALEKLLSGLLARVPEADPEEASGHGPLLGLVAPHIDLAAGGECFARAYRVAEQARKAEVFIILGTGHAGERTLALTRKSFETPLGVAATNQDLVARLERATRFDLFADEFVHKAEHSVEFQVLWLQHVCRRPFTIVPILCGAFPVLPDSGDAGARMPEVAEVASALREIAAEGKGSVVLIAGADLAHVGPRYGDRRPVDTTERLGIEERDSYLLGLVEEVDPEAFYAGVMSDGNRRRICGLSPIYLLLRALQGRKGRRLGHGVWLDPHTGSAVSFASAEIR